MAGRDDLPERVNFWVCGGRMGMGHGCFGEGVVKGARAQGLECKVSSVQLQVYIFFSGKWSIFAGLSQAYTLPQ